MRRSRSSGVCAMPHASGTTVLQSRGLTTVTTANDIEMVSASTVLVTKSVATGGCLSGKSFIDLYSFNGTAGSPVTVNVSTTTGYQMLVAVQSASTGSILTSRFGAGPLTLTYTPPTTAQYFIGFGFIGDFQVSCTVRGERSPRTAGSSRCK